MFYLSYTTYSQDADDVVVYNGGFDFRQSISFNNDFNFQDWYFGAAYGIEDLGYQWGAQLGFQLRPFRKKTVIQESATVTRQKLERKYFLHAQLDKRMGHFYISDYHFQFYFGARGGVLMGNYSGTRLNPENNWVVAPMGGIALNVDNYFFLKLGYIHLQDEVLNVDNGRINCSINFMF